MTKEEAIGHWMPIVSAVFTAEHNIVGEWDAKLKAAKGSPQVEETCRAYVRAVAAEIVDHGDIEFDEE